MLKRKENWFQEFVDYVESVRFNEFKRGDHDCAIFVCNVVERMTGHDLAAEFRNQYKTKKQAVKELEKQGCKNVFDIALKKGGKPYQNVNFAKRGDVVLLACDEGYSLGVVDLTGKFALTPGEKGIVQKPRSEWLKAWKI